MFSNRLPSRTDVNALSRAVDSLRSSGIGVVDLTESNPTRAGIGYPEDLLKAFADPRGLLYEPQPRGLRETREAVAADCARRGAVVDPDDVVVCASTSEAYSWLFKLLCSPGDTVLVPQPSYPLFEHLTRLEGVRAFPYALRYHGRWEVDFDALDAAPGSTRAVLIVSPNNPTGSFVSRREFECLARTCRERRWALIADEVFADYTLDELHPFTDLACGSDVLTFTLAGASKTVGLPQVKLGWVIVGGPPDMRRPAVSALELIADTFLSVSTPVQLAAASLLREAAPVRDALHSRVRANLNRARELARLYPACTVLRVEGGWSAPVRVPATATEETLVLSLLEHERVLVHPGYFFDFPHEAFIVISLLPEEQTFEDALARTLRWVNDRV
jgi:aspartate/methionine/tyrosine aminotransferase